MSAADPDAREASTPTVADAALAVRAALGVDCRSIERFPTGSGFYVYDVVTTDGQRVVARLATAESRETLAGGVVHLPGRLLGVLQLGETILDLGELLLDLALELLDLSLRDGERVFVELLLVA